MNPFPNLPLSRIFDLLWENQMGDDVALSLAESGVEVVRRGEATSSVAWLCKNKNKIILCPHRNVAVGESTLHWRGSRIFSEMDAAWEWLHYETPDSSPEPELTRVLPRYEVRKAESLNAIDGVVGTPAHPPRLVRSHNALSSFEVLPKF